MNKRAYRHAIWYISQFCMTHVYDTVEGKRRYGSIDGFYQGDKVQVGDLVIPLSTPVSEWYLSWLKEIVQHEFGRQYVLESLETGKECLWSNIGISYIDRETLARFPEWRWSDRQWEFRDRWFRNDDYDPRPVSPVFHDDGSVTLGLRRRWENDQKNMTKTFPNWKKVTKQMMADFYKGHKK